MFEIFPANGGGFFWHLKSAQNGQIICVSEVYASNFNAHRGVEAIADAPVYDRTPKK